MHRVKGWILMRRRAELGLSQEQVAELAGLKPKFISDLETGHRNNPGICLFLPLVKALNIDINDAVEEIEDEGL